MPADETSARRKLHTRTITIDGYQREDGLFDVEAEIRDEKTYAFDVEHRAVTLGEPLHHMHARLTVTPEMEIVGAAAQTFAGPFSICPGGAESFDRLTGLVITPGVLKAANERLGGVISCTHLRELLQQMATVALQTTFILRSKRDAEIADAPPRQLNTCYAYDSNRSAMKARYPKFYTGPETME